VKRLILFGCLIILLLGCLWAPVFTTYAHMALDADIAAAFPESVSGLQLILHGNGVLPLTLMPALGALSFREGLLLWGIILTVLGAVLALFRQKIAAYAAAALGLAGVLPLMLFAFYAQQLDQSLLFDMMLTARWYVWAPFALSAALWFLELLSLRKYEKLPLSDSKWRLVSAILCAVTLLLFLFPFVQTNVSSGVFASPAEDALATRTVTGWAWMTQQEPLLKELSTETGLFTAPTQGGEMQNLILLSDSGNNVKNVFMIPTNNGSANGLAIAAAALLLLGMVLQMIRKVDRWIPTGVIAVGTLLLISEVVGMLTVNSSYQFLGAAYQMMDLGLGGYTLFPLLVGTAAAGASVSSAIGIRRADSPYFVNPIPQKKRLLAVSLILAVSAAVLLFMPVFQVNLYTPGKINQSSPTVSQPLSGIALVTFRQPDGLLNPQSSRGKALYTEEAAKNDLTLQDFQAVITGALRRLGILTILISAASLLAVGLLVAKRKNKRLIIGFLLLSALLQAVAITVAGYLVPKDVGFVQGMGSLYVAMGISVFAAFFAGFLDREELPKKYKLFLMMLPFLVAVFLFAYLPLSGWRFAFYNYKLGLTMDQQEYVGFKWFTSLWSNNAQRTETVRVLTNTFAMSGLGLAFSWLPVAFAIFLTEIRIGPFKKFVQIFTTLPNFISWVLVFSFALSIFSLDTGIVNKMLIQLGLLREPVAWLNSSENIWIKMWLWNTWKSLGWGAIMYLAAIAGIDQELYEAARVDGAGRWRQILHITIPGLLPTFFVLLLLQISNIVNNGMEQYLVFQNAMNKSTIEVLDLYVYNISLGTRSTTTISMATAIGILKSLVSIVLLFAANRFSKAIRGESIV
jgi:putative aldouronate transport system permease protein